MYEYCMYMYTIFSVCQSFVQCINVFHILYLHSTVYPLYRIQCINVFHNLYLHSIVYPLYCNLFGLVDLQYLCISMILHFTAILSVFFCWSICHSFLSFPLPLRMQFLYCLLLSDWTIQLQSSEHAVHCMKKLMIS